MASSLDELSAYIKEKRARLDEILSHVGLTRDQLLQNQPKLVRQCTFNPHHYVPEESLQKHLSNCPYSSLNMSSEQIKAFSDHSVFTYPDNSGITLDSSTITAIRLYIDNRRREEWNYLSQPSSMAAAGGDDGIVSLETNEISNEILQSSDPILLIRHIKSWSLIPAPFCQLVPSAVHPVSLKSWLFQNIPENHAFKHEVGGELHIADVVLYQFNLTPAVTPDMLAERLRPFLFSAARGFVLSMWKFLSILKIQQEHSINDNTVQELLPLPVEDKKTADSSLVSKIKTLANLQSSHSATSLPLPMEYSLASTEEKRVLYDYVIELGRGERSGQSKDYMNDPFLFRDDAKILSAKAKEKRLEDEKSHLEQLKEMRDVKRRRQSYRAKNVHITRKSVKQVFQEIIATRTEELRAAAQEADQQLSEVRDYPDRGSNAMSSRSRERSTSREKIESFSESSMRKKRHKKSKSRERSRSREKSRDRSRERHKRRRESRDSHSSSRSSHKHKKHRTRHD